MSGASRIAQGTVTSADEYQVWMALAWLVQGALLGTLVIGGRSLRDRWRRVRRRVMMYPGPTAMVTYLAIELIPVAACLIAAAVVVGQIGLAPVAGLLATVGALGGFAAMCVIGLLLPNLDVADPVSDFASPRPPS